MDSETIEMLRTSPGSIGDIAYTYSRSFWSMQVLGTDDPEMFKKVFLMTIIRRAQAFEILGKKDGNLLLPIHTKGIDEIYRVVDKLGIVGNVNKLDLPTMTLYSMLLESEYLRTTFYKANIIFYKVALEIIHQEIRRTCPKQVRIEETEFVETNLYKIRPFLAYLRPKPPNLMAIIDSIFAGGKTLDLTGDKTNNVGSAGTAGVITRLERLNNIEHIITNLWRCVKREEIYASSSKDPGRIALINEILTPRINSLETERNLIEKMTDKNFNDFYNSSN